MLTFTVHEQPNPPADRIDRAERLTFVRDGFSWTAALFAPVWLLAHRLWWPFLGYLAAEGVIELVRQSELLHPGWTTLGSVSGRNAEDCERRFYDTWLPSQPVLARAAS